MRLRWIQIAIERNIGREDDTGCRASHVWLQQFELVLTALLQSTLTNHHYDREI